MLAGIAELVVYDMGLTEIIDLGSNFFLTEADVGKPRAAPCVKKLAELNSYVKVSSYSGKLDSSFLKQFTLVIVTETTLEESLRINGVTHAHKIPFISADIRGLYSQVFCDFGPEFIVNDVDGEEPASGVVAAITCDKEGMVTINEARHGLSKGDLVKFHGCVGMEGLNDGVPRQILEATPVTFNIGDTSKLGAYQRGGYWTAVKQPKVRQASENAYSTPDASASPIVSATSTLR